MFECALLLLKNYYQSFIKKEIIGMKKEAALKKLGNILACPVITKDTKESVHIRFFTCTMEMKPNMDRWLGTIAKFNYCCLVS